MAMSECVCIGVRGLVCPCLSNSSVLSLMTTGQLVDHYCHWFSALSYLEVVSTHLPPVWVKKGTPAVNVSSERHRQI